MCGVKIALFLPLKILAISEDKRPNVYPVASTTYHYLSTLSGLAMNVLFIDFSSLNKFAASTNVNVRTHLLPACYF